MLKKIGLSFGIGATTTAFDSAFKSTTSKLGKLGDTVSMLNQRKLDIIDQDKDVSFYRGELKRIGGVLDDLKSKKTNLKIKLQTVQSEEAVRELKEEIKDVDSHIRRVSSKKLRVKNELDKATDNAKTFNKSVVRIGRSIDAINKKKIDIQYNKDKMASYHSSVIGAVGATASLVGVVKSASETMKAQGELATLGFSTEGLNNLTSEAYKTSMKYGQVLPQNFIKSSYAIKSGIASLSEEGVTQFTKMASTVAVATKSSMDDITNVYSKTYGIFRKDFASDKAFGEALSGGFSQAVKMFETNGADMSRGMMSLGAVAKVQGVKLEEQFAVLGSAKTLAGFASASEASTSYSAFLSGATKAQEKLGLSFTDTSGKLLPMADILDTIKGKYGELEGNASALLELEQAFGGKEAIKIIAGLVNQTDALRESQEVIKKAMTEGLSKAEVMAMSAQMGQGFARLGNTIGYLSYTIGKTLYPAVEKIAGGLKTFADKIALLDEKFPFATKAVAVLGGSVLALGAIVPAVGYSFYFLRNGIAQVGLASAILKGKLVLATTAMRGLNLAMLANPVGLLVGGIALVATLIYKYWKPISTFFQGVWGGITEAVKPLSPMIENIGKAFSPLFAPLRWLGKAFSWLITPVDNVSDGTLTMGQTVGRVVGKMVGGLVSFVHWWVDTIGFGWSMVKTIFSYSPLGLIIKAWKPVTSWIGNFVSSITAPFEKFFSWIGDKIGSTFGAIGSIADSVGNFFDFGGDDSGGKTKLGKVALATATVGTLATATPAPSYEVQQPQSVIEILKEDKSTHNETLVSNYNNKTSQAKERGRNSELRVDSINVNVQNANSEIDIERAVKTALKKAERDRINRSLEDDF